MRALATRPRRLALAVAMISAVTLGTVSASAATASGPSTVTSAAPTSSKHPEPAKGTALAIAYRPTTNAQGDVNTANDKFAACMRDQDQEYFPDFHASKDEDGHVRLSVKVTGKHFDPTTDAYQDALDACAPILEKAGITFPPAPGLPPLPGPGKGTRPGKSLHIQPGKPAGKPDLPSLTSVIEHA